MSAGSGHPCRHPPHHDCGLDHRPRPFRHQRHERHARRHPARRRQGDISNRVSRRSRKIDGYSGNTQFSRFQPQRGALLEFPASVGYTRRRISVEHSASLCHSSRRSLRASHQISLRAPAISHPHSISNKSGVLHHEPALARQQCLYFFPLPQGQGALRPRPPAGRGARLSSARGSW
jgi:hypothetical protein